MTKKTAPKKPAKRSTKESGKRSSEAVKVDLYAKITDRIVASLDAGVRPWLKPWSGPAGTGGFVSGVFPKRVNGQRYTGINVVLLWSAAAEKGYANSTWMTFKQAIDLGGAVRKGEKGETVVYANRFSKTEKDEKTGEDKTRSIPFLKAFTVFNVEQIDGLPERFYNTAAPAPVVEETPKQKLERIASLDAFFAATGAEVKHGGNRAFFSPGMDFIQLPDLQQFVDVESYYATKGHEFVHWTGHEKRLAREFGKRFGDDAYAAEELVAELGSAFLCAILGLTPEVREDHASYIASWIKVLKGDKRFIFTAASAAQKAVDHLQSYAGGMPVDETEETDAVAEAADLEAVS